MTLLQPQVRMSHAEQTAYFALVKEGKVVATPAIMGGLLGIDAARASRLLYQLEIKKAARRIGKGKYVILAPELLRGDGRFVQDSFIVASQLMAVLKQDYAIAYLSAAYLHGLLEQIPQITQVAVTKKRRPTSLSESQVIKFITVLPQRFFGVVPLRYGGAVLSVTDVEKTMVDCLDRLDLVGGLDQAVAVLAAGAAKAAPGKLLSCARDLHNQSLIQRLGYLLDRMKLLPEVARSLRRLKRRVPCLLDPRRKAGGKLDSKWSVFENVTPTLEGRP